MRVRDLVWHRLKSYRRKKLENIIEDQTNSITNRPNYNKLNPNPWELTHLRDYDDCKPLNAPLAHIRRPQWLLGEGVIQLPLFLPDSVFHSFEEVSQISNPYNNNESQANRYHHSKSTSNGRLAHPNTFSCSGEETASFWHEVPEGSITIETSIFSVKCFRWL